MATAPKKKRAPKLTAKKLKFVAEWLVDLNGKEAAIRSGYSPRSAKQIAANIMTEPEVRDAMDKAQAELSRRTGISADRVIRELANLAFFDPGDLGTWGAEGLVLHDSAALTSWQRKLLIKVRTKNTPAVVERREKFNGAGQVTERHSKDTEPSYSVAVEFADRTKALNLLGQHLGLWPQGDAPADSQAAASRIRQALQAMEATVGGPTDAPAADAEVDAA